MSVDTPCHSAELAPPAGPVRVARAIVDAGAVATSYLRAGAGAPVVLLTSAHSDDVAGGPLLAGLAAHYRVIAPDLAAGGPTPAGCPTCFAAWLRGVLDGIGAGCVSIVAEEAYALRVLSFVFSDPARVDRVALFFHDAPDPLLGWSGHQMLIQRLSPDARDNGVGDGAVADIVRFLGREPSAGRLDRSDRRCYT
jgi:hypothetical protein